MVQDDDFTDLIRRLETGDEQAAEVVFHRFVPRLVGLAHSQLDTWVRHKVDPEDVVQSVLKSFFARQSAGPFTLTGWDSLWALLSVITLRKCRNHSAYWHRERRWPGQEVSLLRNDSPTREPSPGEAAILTETLDQLFQGLVEREQEILALHLQGAEIPAIALAVSRTQRTVRRALETARERLLQLLERSGVAL